MDTRALFPTLVCSCLVWCALAIRIEKNAYTGIVISFSDGIKEENFDFEKFQSFLNKSSEILHHATKKRAYFKEFSLILPSTWTGKMCTSNKSHIRDDKVDIYVTGSFENVVAQHSRGCGKKGDILYMSPYWLHGSRSIEELAREFVREWATYRYGVFEENPAHDICHVSPDTKQYSPAGCYNTNISVQPTFSQDGLPLCRPPDRSELENITSSLMFKTNVSEATNFCDGSPEYPHHAVMPTLHNNLCGGRTVWSVIESSHDFQHGRNPPSGMSSDPEPPTIRCFRESAQQLTFVIQNSSYVDTTKAIEELRFFLYHFIRIFVRKHKINLATFSDDSEIKPALKLYTANEKELLEFLDKHVYTTRVVTSVCLLCGIQKALDVSNGSSQAVVIAFQSALDGFRADKLKEILLPQVKLHLIILNASQQLIPADVLEVISSAGGSLHVLPDPHIQLDKEQLSNVLVYQQLNIILSTVLRSRFQVHDTIQVVHAATFKKMKSNFDDSFSIRPTDAELVHIIQCDLKGQLWTTNFDCEEWKTATTFICGKVMKVKSGTVSKRSVRFEVRENIRHPTCTSTALLLSPSSESLSLKGWFNQYTVTPGKDFLIIYAEVIGGRANVSAEISGPGLQTPYEMELRDNGNGDPYVKRNDGIYSRYFTSYREKGIYAVTVTAKIQADQDEFVLKKILGSFIVTENIPDVDMIPPNRVVDLIVTSIGQNGTVTLQWTAPGDDMDSGKAMAYEIKSASHPAQLADPYFSEKDLNSFKLVQNVKISGSKETYEFDLSGQYAFHYIALRAKDAANNIGKISNVVQVYLKTDIPVTEHDISTSEMNSSTITSLSDESSSDLNNTTTSEFTEPHISSTTENNFNVTMENSWKDLLTDERFIILLSSFGGFILILIIINIIICICCFRKIRKSSEKAIGKLPSYNIAYQQDPQSQSISDVGASLTSLDNQTFDFPVATERYVIPPYSYHTSKSLLNKSQTDSELGFQLVDIVPPYATRSLRRIAHRMNDSNPDENSPAAQPQQPSVANKVEVYSLGDV